MAKSSLRSGTQLSILLVLTMISCGRAGEPAVLGRKVQAGQPISAKQLDHSTWSDLLEKYVDEQGMVDYARWKAKPSDRRALSDYLEHLSAVAISQAPADVRLAFWINAYNAVTIEGILREYPTTSIRNHTAKIIGYNIWNDLKLRVEGRAYSLEEMEHDILRKLGEPRIHFAIVCASIGCPPLRREAYLADKLDEQLADNTKRFFAHPDKFRYDATRRRLAVSPILDWFSQDFGDTQTDRLRQIAPYLPDATARQLARSGDAQIIYLDYDWGLNDQATHGKRSSR